MIGAARWLVASRRLQLQLSQRDARDAARAERLRCAPAGLSEDAERVVAAAAKTVLTTEAVCTARTPANAEKEKQAGEEEQQRICLLLTVPVPVPEIVPSARSNWGFLRCCVALGAEGAAWPPK